MKRILALVLSALFVAFPVCAVETDYASLSTDELLEMRDEIEAEIYSRVSSDTWLLHPGDYYVVGDVDPSQLNLSIKEGFYTVSYGECYAESSTGDHIWVEGYPYDKASNLDATAHFSHTLKCGESRVLNLMSGMMVSVGSGTALLQPIEKPAYMP